MFKKLDLFCLAGLFVLLTFATTTIADVGGVIEQHKQSKKMSESNDGVQNKALRGSRDGIQMGQEEFDRTCAICHGKKAKGDGLFSGQLKQKPSDLTQISRKNKGVFPALKIYKIIDGRDEQYAHGSRAMPVWGMRYSAESWFDVSTQHAETVARGKIFELILFLESIQE